MPRVTPEKFLSRWPSSNVISLACESSSLKAELHALFHRFRASHRYMTAPRSLTTPEGQVSDPRLWMANAGTGSGQFKISGAAFSLATGPRNRKYDPLGSKRSGKRDVRLDNVIPTFCNEGPYRARHTARCRGLRCL